MADKKIEVELKAMLADFSSHCSALGLAAPYPASEHDEILGRHLYTAQRVNEICTSGMPVVNISGCGTGPSDIVLSAAFARQGRRFISYDTSANPYFVALKSFEGLNGKIDQREHLISATGEERSESVELDNTVVLFTEIAEHIDLSYIYQTLSALSGKAVTIYATTPNIQYWKNIAKLILNRPIFGLYSFEDVKRMNCGHIHLFDMEYFKEIFRSAGFELTEEHYATWPQTASFTAKRAFRSRLGGTILEIVAKSATRG